MLWLLPILLLLPCLCGGCAGLPDRLLTVAENGTTDYVIVSQPGVETDFGVAELSGFLKQATGVEFRHVTVEEAESHARRIVIGDNRLSRRLLGDKTIASLAPETSLVREVGGDVVLCGGDGRGTLYAVYSFLENELGCRWYTARGDVHVPKHTPLAIRTGLDRLETPAFRHRHLSTYFYPIRPDKDLFFFRNRLNGNIGSYKALPALTEALPHIGPGCHTSFFYVNPGNEYHPAWASYPKPSRSGFFETHPEFYSMNAEGKRVKTLQLCFSNPQLRQTLAEQVADVIGKTGLSEGVVTLDAEDVPGRFCHCPDCRKLEEQYGAPAGPLLDSLIELCGALKATHPGLYVKTLAYRKNQSEIPPAVTAALPDNLIICFAPIDSNFAAPLNHPTNKDTLENLREWCRIATNVWVWYYTNPYCTLPPYGNVEKMCHDVRLMKDIGVTGTYFEHGCGVAPGYNFSDLQTWLLLKLFQNSEADTAGLITEFTDYYYGAAAPMVRAYIEELEALRKALPIQLPWNPSLAMFTYLTPERIARWQDLFDRMETQVADSPDDLRHVRLCRITLDTALLYKWQEIKAGADIAMTPKDVGERMLRNFDEEAKVRFPGDASPARNVWRTSLEKSVAQLRLQAEANPKPLPESFRAHPPEDVKQAFPMEKKLTDDADAACGVATVGEWTDVPLDFGLYDNSGQKWLLSHKITKADIQPDRYASYKLGRSALTPHCLVWVTTGWVITVAVEQFYVVGDPFLEWDLYASLKFEGPLFGSTDQTKPNRISCDRIILVKVTE